MKIEFTCEHCRSVLRLPAEHAGKRARCPVCSSLVLVPLETGSSDAVSSSENSVQNAGNVGWGGYKPADDLIQSEPLAKPIETIPPRSILFSTEQTSPNQSTSNPSTPFAPTPGQTPSPNPFAAPQRVPAGYYQTPQSNRSDNDGLWIAGLITGILSICVQCACCWMGSLVALPLSLVGIVCTMFSKSSYRWVCFLLNGIGLLMALAWIVFIVVMFAMDANF